MRNRSVVEGRLQAIDHPVDTVDGGAVLRFECGNAGFGIGVRYATLLPDVFVGIDGNLMVAFIPASAGDMVIVPGVSFAPVIKYVF